MLTLRQTYKKKRKQIYQHSDKQKGIKTVKRTNSMQQDTKSFFNMQ